MKEKLCLLKFELLFLFLRIKTAIPINLLPYQIPHPENPLNNEASVLIKTFKFFNLIIFETIPHYKVGITISTLLKILEEYPNFPNPKATIYFPTNFYYTNFFYKKLFFSSIAVLFFVIIPSLIVIEIISTPPYPILLINPFIYSL